MVCGVVGDRKGSEVSRKGPAMKTSMSEMVSLGDERRGVKVFLVGSCREKSFSD